jgi:cysteinyl-tRNA synthetase
MENSRISEASGRLLPLADKLNDLRIAAMQSKDFTQVDRLKSALVAAGVEVRMSKSGVDLMPGPNFDPAKLEGL